VTPNQRAEPTAPSALSCIGGLFQEVVVERRYKESMNLTIELVDLSNLGRLDTSANADLHHNAPPARVIWSGKTPAEQEETYSVIPAQHCWAA
jgi:hypothetical protein